MPVLRTRVCWYTKYGRRRRIRLYRAWANMKCRVRGIIKDGGGKPIWVGLQIDWPSWEAFRDWALANGYNRLNNSLDRRDETKGYGPGNCRWIPVEENSRLAMFNTRAKKKAKCLPDAA